MIEFKLSGAGMYVVALIIAVALISYVFRDIIRTAIYKKFRDNGGCDIEQINLWAIDNMSSRELCDIFDELDIPDDIKNKGMELAAILKSKDISNKDLRYSICLFLYHSIGYEGDEQFLHAKRIANYFFNWRRPLTIIKKGERYGDSKI